MSKKPSAKSIIANFGVLAAPGHSASGPPVPSPAPSRVGAGVIGATQRTLSEIREERDRLAALVASGGGLELATDIIDPSPFPDRLPDDGDSDFEALKTLIAEEGQKIPIQVRTHPEHRGRYQIVYGHRRWRACRDLGITVRALLTELSDRELVVAQGIENAARQDLSWIERALFAWRMDAAGIKPRDIRAALAVDDPELARLRAVCRALPLDIIEAIGRAPKVGRPRWVDLATAVTQDRKAIAQLRKTLSADKVRGLPSDERFRQALAAVKTLDGKAPPAMEFRAPGGRVVAKASFTGGELRVSVDKPRAEAFAAFLKAELPLLMDRFLTEDTEQ